MTKRLLKDIAREIEADWSVINNAAAKNALDCMKKMENISDPFGADTNGYAVVGSFVAHAKGWHGETAKRIKIELRQMCGHPRP